MAQVKRKRNIKTDQKQYGKRNRYDKGKERDNSRTMGEERLEDVKHQYNDVSWYTKNPQMLTDAASYSYNSPLGSQLEWDGIWNVSSGDFHTNTTTAVPGLAYMGYVPTIGVSTDTSSPANLAAQNIYSYVRYMNSGAKNYDQADLMLYLLAMDSIYMMWNWAKRIYGYLRTYSQKNRYMPRVYAAADHIDFDAFISSLADYRYKLNSLAAQISSFCVPAVMPLFVRHSWMCSNIYKDADNEKAQQYIMTPEIFYRYDEASSPNGGKLQSINNTLNLSSTDFRTPDEVLDMIKVNLDKVAYSEDIGVMSGDILKAYGQNALFKITPVDPDYMVVPVYNEEVLNQIHNSTLVNAYQTGGGSITQDPNSGCLIWNPTFPSENIQQKKAFINMPWDVVTPSNTMVATRLTALRKSASSAGFDNFLAVGSEFINRRIMYVMNSNGSFQVYQYGNNIFIGDGNDAFISQLVGYVSNFDWHPLMPVIQQTGTADSPVFTMQSILGDITNYTVIDGEQMKALHTTAILSEFNVPQLGSF